MIIGYRIIECRYIENLEELVMAYIAKGWQPFGGLLCILDSDNKHVFMQTVVKENE